MGSNLTEGTTPRELYALIRAFFWADIDVIQPS